MAQLPDVTALGRRPAISAKGAFYEPADTSVAGQALARFGEVAGAVVGKAVEEQQQRDAREEVFAARRALDDWERRSIYDPVNGAATKRGRDAFGVSDELIKGFDAEAEKIAKGMKSGLSVRAFHELATARRAQVGDWAAKHTAREREVYRTQAFEADVASMHDRAVRIAAEPPDATPEGAARHAAEVRAEVAIAQRRITEFMRERGMPAESISEAVKKFSSKVHAGVVGSLITAGDAERARDYLKANEAEMSREEVTRLRGDMRELVTRQTVQKFGDEIEPGIESGDMTLGAALDKARERFPAGTHERSAAVQEVKARFTESEANKAQAKKDAVDAAWRVIVADGRRSAIRPDLWNSLPAEEQRQIIDWLDAKRRQAKAEAEGKTETDPGKLAQIIDMATDPARQSEFLAMDLERVQPYLSKGDFSRVLWMRSSINKDQARAAREGAMMKATVDSLKDQILRAGLDPTPKEGSGKAEKWAMFSTQLRLALLEAAGEKQAQGKGPLDQKEMREIGERMLAEQVTQTGFFATRKRGYEVAAERAEALAKGEEPRSYVRARYGDIPEIERARIVREQFPGQGRAGEGVYRGGGAVLTPEQERVVELIYTHERGGGSVKARVEFDSIPAGVRALILRDQADRMPDGAKTDADRARIVNIYQRGLAAGLLTPADWQREAGR